MAAHQLQTFVEIFFNYEDASTWIDGHIQDFDEKPEWALDDLEIKLMPSGGYRAGITFKSKQVEMFDTLFGATEDA